MGLFDIFFLFLCVAFFCRLFYFLSITTELLFEFLNYCGSNRMLKASMERSYFLENYTENSPERAHGEIIFLQLQGTVTELVILMLVILGAGLHLGLVPLPAGLHQCRAGLCLHEPCWALKAPLCSCTGPFCPEAVPRQPGLARAVQGTWGG